MQDCKSSVTYVGWYVDSPFGASMHCTRCRKEGVPGAELTCFVPRFKLQKIAAMLEAAKRSPKLETIRARPLGDVYPTMKGGQALRPGETEMSRERLVAELEFFDAETLLKAIEAHAGEEATAGLAVLNDNDELARQKLRAEAVVDLVFRRTGGRGLCTVHFEDECLQGKLASGTGQQVACGRVSLGVRLQAEHHSGDERELD